MGRGRSFGKRLSEFSERRWNCGSRNVVERWRTTGETERLRREVSHHLRDRPLSDRDKRLQNELGWQDDRGNLLRFLDDPGIEPTNNRAERALRGAVIARKVSHCSRNESWCGCVQCVHQCDQDPGSARWGSVGGGRSVRCVQRRACPHPLHLNLSPRPTPLINCPVISMVRAPYDGIIGDVPLGNAPVR